MNRLVEKAISICGSQNKLATLCEVKQSSVNKWLHGEGIKGCHISPIVRATNGQITHQEICDELERLALQKQSNKG